MEKIALLHVHKIHHNTYNIVYKVKCKVQVKVIAKMSLIVFIPKLTETCKIHDH